MNGNSLKNFVSNSEEMGKKQYTSQETTYPYFIRFLAPEGPPLNIQVTTESSSSLSVTWEAPEKNKRNGKIVNYTVCISHEESKPCFKEYTTKKKMLVISNLNVSTKYYVRVLASTKVGRGNYSESERKFTNGSKLSSFINQGLAIVLLVFLLISIFSIFMARTNQRSTLKDI